MRGWGTWMIILGVGSLLLPLLGVQFVLMALLDPWQPFAGIGVALAGMVMLTMGLFSSEPADAPGDVP